MKLKKSMLLSIALFGASASIFSYAAVYEVTGATPEERGERFKGLLNTVTTEDQIVFNSDISVLRGTGKLDIPSVTIKSANNSKLHIEGSNLNLTGKVSFENLKLSLKPTRTLNESFEGLGNRGPDAKPTLIVTNGHSLTLNKITTKVDGDNADTRPIILIGGGTSSEPETLTVIGADKTAESKFHSVVVDKNYTLDRDGQLVKNSSNNTDKNIIVSLENGSRILNNIYLGGLKNDQAPDNEININLKSQYIGKIDTGAATNVNLNISELNSVGISGVLETNNKAKFKNVSLDGTSMTIHSDVTIETLTLKNTAEFKLKEDLLGNKHSVNITTLKSEGNGDNRLTIEERAGDGSNAITVTSVDIKEGKLSVAGDKSGLNFPENANKDNEGNYIPPKKEEEESSNTSDSNPNTSSSTSDPERDPSDTGTSGSGNTNGTGTGPGPAAGGDQTGGDATVGDQAGGNGEEVDQGGSAEDKEENTEEPGETEEEVDNKGEQELPKQPAGPAGPKDPEENNTTVEPGAGTGSGGNTGPGASANSPGAAGESAGTPGAAGESAGTPGAAGESASTPGAAGESASTPGAAGESAGTPGAEGESASTPGAAGESASTPGAEGESAGTPSAGNESAATPSAGSESAGSSGNAGTVQPAKPVTPKPVEPVKPAPVKPAPVKPEPPKAPKPAEKSIQERITDALKGLFAKAHLNKKQQQQAVEKTEESLSNLTRAYTDYDFSFSLDAARVTEDRLNDLTMFNDLESASIDNYAFLAQSAKALKNHNSVWVSSSLAEQRGDGDSKRRLSTINLGYDRQFDNLILGGFVSYLRQKGERGELSSKLHGYSFSLYGKYYQNAHEVIALLNTGRTKAELQRNISALGVSNQADAKGKFVGLRVEYGYRMPFEQYGLQIKPLVGLSYNLGRQAAFTESGKMPVHVGKIKAQRLSLETGVELRKYFETAYVYVKPTIQTDLMARSNDVDILFVNSPNSIPFKSAIKKKTYFALSLGTQVQLRKNLLLDVNANSRIGNNERDIQGSVKLGYKF